MDPLGDAAQHLLGARGAVPRGAADNPGNVLLFVRGHPWVDPLGAERHVDVDADLEPTLGQRPDQQVFGGARVRRGGQHQQLTATSAFDDPGARGAQRAHVGHLIGIDRGGDADDDDIGGGQRARIGRQLEFGVVHGETESLQIGRDEVDVPGTDPVEAVTTDIEAGDLVTGTKEGKRRREADITHSNDRHPSVLSSPDLGSDDRFGDGECVQRVAPQCASATEMPRSREKTPR